MKRPRLSRHVLGLGLIALLCVLGASTATSIFAAPPTRAAGRVCGLNVPQDSARCFAWTDGVTGPTPTGLSPSDIKTAYNFSTSNTAGTGQTIAIVDAFDDPTAEADLATFSSQYGLPACTTGNGCFKKVNQTGGSSYPSADGGWALEISLDVQWAHAIAPGAKILLVETTTNSFLNLFAGEDYAKTHAQYVSNSWGGSEGATEHTFDSHFVQSGVSFFVSAGDNGTPAEYPSASPKVISVGGTRLQNIGLSNQKETVWNLTITNGQREGGGGGCSKFESKNAKQKTGTINCNGKRATPDVSLDADPQSGVSVYDSTCYQTTSGCQTGWFRVGGTSASSPMWAARSAVAGVLVNAKYVYGSHITFRDIKKGNNGAPAGKGYDLATGLGSWTGTTP